MVIRLIGALSIVCFVQLRISAMDKVLLEKETLQNNWLQFIDEKEESPLQDDCELASPQGGSFFSQDQILYAYAARQGDAKCMEDVVMLRAKERLTPIQKMTLGLFDGSHGKDTALYALKHLDRYISKMAGSNNDEASFSQAFKKLNREIIANKLLNRQRTTAILARINGLQLTFGWVGNSRGIVMRNGQIIYSTAGHSSDSSTDEEDQKIAGRSKSHMKTCRVKDGDIVLLASYGLWSALSNEQVCDLVRDRMEYSVDELDSAYPRIPSLRSRKKDARVFEEGSDPLLARVARALRDEAYNEKSTDNISLLMVKIQLDQSDLSQ